MKNMVQKSSKKPKKMYKIAEKRPIHSKVLPKNYNESTKFCYMIYILYRFSSK
jgi:hypothetical protein